MATSLKEMAYLLLKSVAAISFPHETQPYDHVYMKGNVEGSNLWSYPLLLCTHDYYYHAISDDSVLWNFLHSHPPIIIFPLSFWEILFLFYMYDCFPCMYEHALCVHNGKGVSQRKLCPLELELQILFRSHDLN